MIFYTLQGFCRHESNTNTSMWTKFKGALPAVHSANCCPLRYPDGPLYVSVVGCCHPTAGGA